MQTVSLFDAKTLVRLVDQIASAQEDEIVISRNGKPVARLFSIAPMPAGESAYQGELRFPTTSTRTTPRSPNFSWAKLEHAIAAGYANRALGAHGVAASWQGRR
jgi:prevent-host-death family protein